MLGLLVLLDGVLRLPLIKDYYSGSGIFPRGFYTSELANSYETSIYFISDFWFIQTLLLCFTLLCGVMLIIGYRTKIATIICWIMVMSLQNRNSWTLNGGDILFRCLLFWSMFAPLGRYFSVDQILSKRQNKIELHFSPGSFALLLQVFAVYIFTAILKWHPAWYWDGTALYYALHIDLFAKPIGVYLRQFETLLRWMTYYVLALEGIGPLLVILPFWKLRTFVVFLFFNLHLGIELTMEVGLFPFTCIVAWTAFLPGEFWDFLKSERHFQLLDKINRRLAAFIPSIPLSLFPQWNIDKTNYNSKLRYSVCSIFIVIAGVWNVESVDSSTAMPEPLNYVSAIFDFNQHWAMFAPHPRAYDGWLVFQAELMDGQLVDIKNNGQPSTFEKPENIATQLRDLTWGNVYYAFWSRDKNSKIHDYLAGFHCRDWNSEEPSEKRKMRIFRLFRMSELTPPPGEKQKPVTKKLVIEHKCFKNSKDIF